MSFGLPLGSRERSWLHATLFLGPPLAYLFAWKILPLLYTGYLSLTAWNPTRRRPPVFVGADNYVQILSDPQFRKALLVTVAFTVVATLIEVLLGLLFALLVERQMRGASVVRTALLLPIVIAPVVVGTIWYILYHDTIGPISALARSLGHPVGWLRDPDVALISVIIADVWHWTPFCFLILLTGLQAIPDELTEAASLDGAGYLQRLRHVTLPLLKGALVAALTLRSMDAFRIFDEILLMTGGGPGDATTTATVLIYKNAFKFFQIGYSSAMVIILLIATSILYLGYMRYVEIDDPEPA